MMRWNRNGGFLDALKQGRVDPASSVCIQGYFDENVTFSAVLALAASPRHSGTSRPTAYACGNDRSAIGALRQPGYSVPNQVSVEGFDDMELSQHFQPVLTTVRNPIKQQAQMAVAMMVDMTWNSVFRSLGEPRLEMCRFVTGTYRLPPDFQLSISTFRNICKLTCTLVGGTL